MTIAIHYDIATATKNTLKYIPTVWPLYQFVATNPMWKLIDSPIYETTKKMHSLCNVKTTLPLKSYWNEYSNKNITDHDVHRAINDCVDLLRENMGSLSSDDMDLSLQKQFLYEFITSEECLQKIIKIVSDNQQELDKSSCTLLSYQIQPHSYDNILEKVSSDCLDVLSRYYNSDRRFYLQSKDDDINFHKKYSLLAFWWANTQRKGKKWHDYLSKFSRIQPNEIISKIFLNIELPEEKLEQYIFEIFWQMKGWIGFVEWENHNSADGDAKIDLSEIIAIWLLNENFYYEKVCGTFILSFEEYAFTNHDKRIKKCLQTVWTDYIDGFDNNLSENTLSYIKKVTRNFPMTSELVSWVWQRAYELSYESPLYKKLINEKNQLLMNEKSLTDKNTKAQPKAQWIFCIDVRSEGLRRHIEAQDCHETYGFAGFFGFDHKLYNSETNKVSNQCPALIKPSLLAKIFSDKKNIKQNLNRNFQNSNDNEKKSLLAPFATYEIMGFWFAILLVIRNYSHSFIEAWKQKLKMKSKHQGNVKSVHVSLDTADVDKLVTAAKSLLKGINLIENFSKFVIVCGHSAATVNNPYQAALDCGACGGNSGLSNAILACQVLNDPDIRHRLATEGIRIPTSTTFIAACHNTTTDEIEWYAPEGEKYDFKLHTAQKIISDAKQATIALQKERLRELPGDNNVLRRSQHWAELIPEWGLAGNASMIIGPRNLTVGIDLERRAFLHSYEDANDPDGKILESIMLGPLVVAHWINAQYYFSTVDPVNYGSGNKAIHNVLPYIGVMEGNQSDIKYGLAKQSVYFKGKPIHKPVRLSVFIDADSAKIKSIVSKHKVLQSLINGHWIWLKPLSVKADNVI